MSNTHNERNQFIAHVRDLASRVLAMKAEMEELTADWDGGMSTYLVDASGADPEAVGYEGNDFTPNHEGLMKADVTAAFTAFGNIITAFGAGNITNLINVKRY